MLVYSSARAGMLAIQTPKGFDIEDLSSGEVIKAGSRDVSYYFANADDLVIRDKGSIETARNLAKNEWSSDRALALFLFILDPAELGDGMDELACFLEEQLNTSPVIGENLENVLFSNELPQPIAFKAISEALKPYPKSLTILVNFVEFQPYISHVREVFNRIRIDVFEDGRRERFERAAIQRGAFRKLVLADAKKENINQVLFSLHQSLSDQYNYREVIKAWTDNFSRTERVAKDWAALRDAPTIAPVANYSSGDGRRAFERAMSQQKTIIGRLKAGEVDTARAFARDLIAQQKRESEPEHVAKSLTSLSKEARDLRLHEISLEWAYEAVSAKSDDARAQSQLAEALVAAGRYTDALKALSLAEAFGDVGFATTLRARILRLQHRFDEALEAYSLALEKYAGSVEEPYNMAGVAEVLRDMGRLDEALIIYEQAAKKFEYHIPIFNGLAATYAEMGNSEKALEIYQWSLDLSDNVVTRNGISSVLKSIGDFQGSEDSYRKAVEIYPYDLYSRIGLSDAFYENGKREDALALAYETLSRFKDSPESYQSLGSLFRRQGEIDRAVETFDQGLEHFPSEPFFYSLIASAEGERGNYEAALLILDKGSKTFPNNKFIQSGRAAMLRKLGLVDEALKIYDRILEASPSLQFAKNAKASILIYTKCYDDALHYLVVDNPRTKQDWRAFLLRAHLDIRTGYVKAAQERLLWAIDRVPFDREKRMFCACLASIKLREKRYSEAVSLMPPSRFDITAIIRLHALAASNDLVEAKRVYVAINDNFPAPQYAKLGDEIARRHGLIDGDPVEDLEWVLIREQDALLLEAA